MCVWGGGATFSTLYSLVPPGVEICVCVGVGGGQPEICKEYQLVNKLIHALSPKVETSV